MRKFYSSMWLKAELVDVGNVAYENSVLTAMCTVSYLLYFQRRLRNCISEKVCNHWKWKTKKKKEIAEDDRKVFFFILYRSRRLWRELTSLSETSLYRAHSWCFLGCDICPFSGLYNIYYLLLVVLLQINFKENDKTFIFCQLSII